MPARPWSASERAERLGRPRASHRPASSWPRPRVERSCRCACPRETSRPMPHSLPCSGSARPAWPGSLWSATFGFLRPSLLPPVVVGISHLTNSLPPDLEQPVLLCKQFAETPPARRPVDVLRLSGTGQSGHQPSLPPCSGSSRFGGSSVASKSTDQTVPGCRAAMIAAKVASKLSRVSGFIAPTLLRGSSGDDPPGFERASRAAKAEMGEPGGEVPPPDLGDGGSQSGQL